MVGLHALPDFPHPTPLGSAYEETVKPAISNHQPCKPPKMGYDISHVPNEIIAHIISFLGKRDLQDARLACRRLNEVSKVLFASTFFSAPNTNLSEFSLRKLEKIAQDDVFRLAVQCIQVCPSQRKPRFGHGTRWKRDEDGTLIMNHMNVVKAQDLLGRTFPNCTTLKLRVRNISGTRPEELRFRDYVTELEWEDAVDVFFSSIAHGTHAIKTVFIDSHYVEMAGPWLLSCNDSEEGPMLDKQWGNVQALQLGCEIRSPSAATTALAIITKAKSLRRLSLVDAPDGKASFVQKLHPGLLAATQIPALTHLRFTYTWELTDTILIKLPCLFKESLQTIQFCFVALRGSWKYVCKALREEFHALQSVTINWCQELGTGGSTGTPVFYCALRNTVPESEREYFRFGETHYGGRRYCLSAVCYRGPNAKSALNLIERAMYTWPPPFELLEHRPRRRNRSLRRIATSFEEVIDE